MQTIVGRRSTPRPISLTSSRDINSIVIMFKVKARPASVKHIIQKCHCCVCHIWWNHKTCWSRHWGINASNPLASVKLRKRQDLVKFQDRNHCNAIYWCCWAPRFIPSTCVWFCNIEGSIEKFSSNFTVVRNRCVESSGSEIPVTYSRRRRCYRVITWFVLRNLWLFIFIIYMYTWIPTTHLMVAHTLPKLEDPMTHQWDRLH